MQAKTRLIVSTIIEDGDKILFGRKKENIGPYPNTWHFIGGGVNEDESLEEGMKREIREETGIEVEIVEKLGFDEDYEPNKHGEMMHYVFLFFKTRYVSGTPTAQDDIVDLRWFLKSELPVEELNAPSVRLLKKIGYIK